MKNSLNLALFVALPSMLVNQAHASPINVGPPPGAILDLAGQAIPHSYQQYTVDFTAASALTNLSLAIREDPAFFALDDITMTDLTHPGPNLVVNGGFESGPVGSNAPTGWTYLNTYVATFPGFVDNGSTANPHSGHNEYFDGAVQAYDGISQAIATTTGDTYQVSFWLYDDGNLTTFSALSTNGDVTGMGGNAADVLVYAGAIPNLTGGAVPEPATCAMLGMAGVCFAGYFAFRQRKQIVAA